MGCRIRCQYRTIILKMIQHFRAQCGMTITRSISWSTLSRSSYVSENVLANSRTRSSHQRGDPQSRSRLGCLSMVVNTQVRWTATRIFRLLEQKTSWRTGIYYCCTLLCCCSHGQWFKCSSFEFPTYWSCYMSCYLGINFGCIFACRYNSFQVFSVK